MLCFAPFFSASVSPAPRYSFTGVLSGVRLGDTFGSFNATYVVIPEPCSAALALLAGTGLLRRGR